MARMKRILLAGIGAALVSGVALAGDRGPQLSARTIARIDLAKPFGTRSPWRFTATQGAKVENPILGGMVDGPISVCIARSRDGVCNGELVHALRQGDDGDDIFAVPYDLLKAEIVYPRGASGRPLLLVRLGSLASANGNARVSTQLFAYESARDRFVASYHHTVGHNNNEEVRYVTRGPLKGAVISAEPTSNAPYGFWITVSKLTPVDRYRQVLRYRSATHYGDGNPLAVIDSEMPEIQKRLGLWHPGQSLPLPAAGCAKPHIVKMVLWCN